MNSYSTGWWSLLLINRPREDERLSLPCWLTYRGHLTHKVIIRPASSQVQDRKRSPVKDQRSTTVLRRQLIDWIGWFPLKWSADRGKPQLEIALYCVIVLQRSDYVLHRTTGDVHTFVTRVGRDCQWNERSVWHQLVTKWWTENTPRYLYLLL